MLIMELRHGPDAVSLARVKRDLLLSSAESWSPSSHESMWCFHVCSCAFTWELAKNFLFGRNLDGLFSFEIDGLEAVRRDASRRAWAPGFVCARSRSDQRFAGASTPAVCDRSKRALEIESAFVGWQDTGRKPNFVLARFGS